MRFLFNKRHLLWFIIGCAGMALLGSVLFVNLQAAQTTAAIRSSQNTNTAINSSQTRLLRGLTRVSRRIRACTTAGHQCYDSGQKRTGNAVASIDHVVILAAACSAGLDPRLSVVQRQTRIQTCVIDRLAADQSGH